MEEKGRSLQVFRQTVVPRTSVEDRAWLLERVSRNHVGWDMVREASPLEDGQTRAEKSKGLTWAWKESL